jgi:hypothetical protein
MELSDLAWSLIAGRAVSAPRVPSRGCNRVPPDKSVKSEI